MKRVLLLCLTLALVIAALPTAAAAGSRPVISEYTVTDMRDRETDEISKGDAVNITVSVKDVGVTAEEVGDAYGIDVTRLVDSFSGGVVSVVVTSSGGEPLTYDVTFEHVTYSGVGQSFTFMVGYRNIDEEYTNLEMSIHEAVPYVAVEPTPEPSEEPRAEPAPTVLVSRSEVPGPIAAGQEVVLTVTFENLGRTALRSPVAVFSPSDSLMLYGGSSTFPVEDIRGGESRSIDLRVKVLESNSSAVQSLGVELRFNYDNGVTLTQGTATETLKIPTAVAEAPEKVAQPAVIVTRSALDPISAGQTFELTLNVQNVGKTAMQSAVAAVTTGDSLVLLNNASSFVLGDIAPGQSANISLRIRAAKELSSSTQSVNLELKFVYDSGEGDVQATESERVTLSSNVTDQATPTTRPDGPVPNVIISSFDYGGDAVAAGEKFPLSFTFVNTGSVRVENIVLTVDGGESFTMDGSTNTFHYDSLAPGAEQPQNVPMQTLSAAKTGAQTINVSFKYEYVDGERRASSTVDIKLSVPVYQPDRFQVNEPMVPEFVTVGEEVYLTMNYVNKGKAEISNVEATVEGDVYALTTTQYLGNFESGKSGSINFVITLMNPGETELTLKISYEDANQQLKTQEFPLTISAEEYIYEPDPYDPYDPYMPEEEPKQGLSVWVYVGGGAVLLAALIVLLCVLKKKKAAKAAAAAAAWDDWGDAPASLPTQAPAAQEEHVEKK